MESATRRVGCLLPLGAGGIMAAATVWVIAGIWHSCDVGNGSADGAVLFFCFLLIWGALSSQWGVTLKMLGGKSIAGACAVAFCAAAGICWGLIAWIGVLDSYPAPVCPGNIPPWWPGFVPA